MNFLIHTPHYYLGDKIEKNEMGGACSTYGARKDADKVLVVRLEGKRTLERPRCRWGYNITMDQKVGWGHGLV